MRKINVFKKGDLVEIVKPPVFIGGRGSKNFKPIDKNNKNFIVAYNMSHLVGEKATVVGFIPNIFEKGGSYVKKVKNSKKRGTGFYILEFVNEVDAPVGLMSEGFHESCLKIVKNEKIF